MKTNLSQIKEGRNIIDLCDEPWNLWCDDKASWESDNLYLPGEFDLQSLPVNPPTVGWNKLYDKKDIEENVKKVNLPTTVEEHFWGKYSNRQYRPSEYFYASGDDQVHNGNYRGVSWWWRKVFIPEEWRGKELRIRFRGARLRAEVYLNEKLVGYNIITEIPFKAKITDAAHFGKDNWLAVRITNPGGRLDWPDFSASRVGAEPLRWGNYELPISHGFGGLDAGIQMIVTDQVWIKDIFVKNKPQSSDVTLQITIRSILKEVVKGNLVLSIFPRDNIENVEWKRIANGVNLKPGRTVLNYPVHMPDAKIWNLKNPNLYTAQIKLDVNDGQITDKLKQNFGFRWFEVRNLGENAKFYLNGRRIVLRSAISWGYWPINGLFPTEEMAEKEVRNAKNLGLNMLNFHRNIGKPVVFQKQDQIGLLRYEEPGAGCFSWYENEFSRKYEQEKIYRMVLRDRSHPSLIIYCLQNEQVRVSPDNPYVKEIMDLVHNSDPTRVVVLKSAWSGAPPRKGYPYGGEAFYLPYDNAYYRDDGTGWCGWYDQHTVGGPGIYQDNLYNNPNDFSHRTDNKGETVFWGEVLGVGTLDNLGAIYEFYQNNPEVKGYNKQDHMELYRAYDKFLDEKNFKKTFPTVDDLVGSIGNKSYYFWGRIIENIRICNANDGMAISGWESTPIENHCGLVDVFRDFKANPEMIRYYTRPLHLAIKSHNLVLGKGQSLTTDLYVVNEVDLRGLCVLEFKVIGPNKEVLYENSWDVRLDGGDNYGQLLKENIVTNCYDSPGYYLLKTFLKVDGKEKVSGQERIFVVDWQSVSLPKNGAVWEPEDSIRKFLREKKGIDLPGYSSDLGLLDYILAADRSPTKLELNKELLDRVTRDGTTLILIANDGQIAKDWANFLSEGNVIEFKGMVGTARASWMGNWYFVREHSLFKSLPVNTVFNWEYQTDVRGADGMLLEGENVEYVVGYSRDHDRNIGAAVAVISYGKGKIVISSINGFYDALTVPDGTLHTVIARKLLCNFIRYAKS